VSHTIDSRPLFLGVALALAILGLTTSGCGMNRRYANNQIRQLPFSNAAITYTAVDPGIVAASGGQSNAVAASLGPKTQELIVTYPHPSPRLARKYAEVILKVTPTNSGQPPDRTVTDLLPAALRRDDGANHESGAHGTPHEYRAAITYDEFVFLTNDLVADGFFERGERSGGVDVSVTLGSRTTSKTWDRIKSLEKLIARVQSDHRQQAGAQSAAATLPASAELGKPMVEGLPDEATAQPAKSPPDVVQF
jgi:hypothetical protein